MVTRFRQNTGVHMGRNEAKDQYAAVIVMLVAYANYANEQERIQMTNLAYAKSTVAAMFIYGTLAAVGTVIMFGKGNAWAGWFGVLISVFCFWLLYSNLIIANTYHKTRKTWQDTRKEAESKLFDYSLGAFDD